ncbi:uncharacterized protein LOC127704705 [Mytilus californianus]|uniref:uncharacterized protein LOC127704705 n=1 Tax=Mytilus californianus TaxID=6549 RepID=UPI002246D378|nr:uncharacterized protein LOC127704705 [Mytilus californianus]
MEKNLNQVSPPAYSEPEPSDVDTNPAIYTGASNILTPAHIADIGPPPAYDSILVNQEPPKTNVRHDDRNLWEKVHEWFEMSILQQIIWFGALVFAITYIVFGLKYDGNCSRIHYDGKGKKVEEIDLPSFMKAEGGVLCAYVLFVFGCRLLGICDTKRKQRIKRADLEGRKKCGGNLFCIWFCLSIASFVLCIPGASKVIPFYKYDVSKNYTFNCDSEFYSFYHNAKIAQLVVVVTYAAYILIAIFIVIPKGKVWFVRHKWRQWASLLDADQDGIISTGDMEKTNARLDALRRAIGDRTTALDAEKQKKWWNDHIFKRGVNKDISIDGYINYLEGIYNPADMEKKIRPVITGFFNFFTTPDFRKKNLPIVEEDFTKFWMILTNMDELHCKRLFIRHFLNPLTMASFLEDFVAFLAYNDFFDENTTRVHNILKPPGK